MARNDRNGEGSGRAWFGEASWRCGVWTGLHVVCGHRLGTRRRELFDCRSETKTQLYGADAPFDVARKLRHGTNALCCGRILAKHFIGRTVGLSARARSHAAGRFSCAGRYARCLSTLLHGFARANRSACRICRNRAGFGRQVSLDQPSRQQGTAAFVHPRVEQLRDLLPHVGGKIQSRLFKRLQSGLRRRQEKLPIHFLLEVLSHGDHSNESCILLFY